MKDRAAAIRYARALERALEDDAQLDRTAKELAVVSLILRKDADTAAVFLKLLGDRGHLALLPDIAAAVGRIRDRRLGIVEAEITTAVPLNGDLTARTQETLEKTTGRKVRLAFKTDPALIGGMVAKVGSV